MPVKLENVQITSYQIGVLDNGTDGDDKFVFASQTSMPNGDGDVDGRDFLLWQRSLGPAGSEAHDPLGDFVVTKSLDTTSFQYDGFTGGVFVAAGDVDHSSYNPYVTVDYVENIL